MVTLHLFGFSPLCVIKWILKMLQRMHSHIGCICLTSLLKCLLKHNHTDCICVTFLCCAFSYVSSICLPEKRHNHTGCICLVFLQCVFSNVSSNPMLRGCIVTSIAFVWLFPMCIFKCFKWAWITHRQIHTGCICLTFLHCVFSNASSKNLDQHRQINTGYICLTYLHCTFSIMSSNCLPENRHIHIWMHSFGFFQRVFLNGCSQHLHKKMRCRNDCICFTFLHCAFSNVSSNTPSPRDCIVTLVALWDSTSR